MRAAAGASAFYSHDGAAASKIAKVTYESAIRQSLPFLVSHLVVLVIASASPELVLWFPRLIGAIR